MGSNREHNGWILSFVDCLDVLCARMLHKYILKIASIYIATVQQSVVLCTIEIHNDSTVL